MTATLAAIFDNLTPDPWREKVGFSESVEAVQRDIFAVSQSEAAARLNAWIQKYQPCIFGKMAARFGLIQYCVLTEDDIRSSDDLVQEKIQNSRLMWLQNASRGEQSGFIIALISHRLAHALPDSVMGELAQQLASLYLLEPIEFGQICLDSVTLEVPGRNPKALMWDVGVNYFSASADKRWWQDHCIPGGMAFSMNSVGHMVKSVQLSKGLKALDENVGFSPDEVNLSKLDSLGEALRLAMKTISSASNGPSGKATELLPLPADVPLKKCPINLGSPLSDFDFSEYIGYYHTDVTLPSDYFKPDMERPLDIAPYHLDFTYLFDKSLDNPDFIRMGDGRRIRSAGVSRLPIEECAKKRRRAVPEEIGAQNFDDPPIQSDSAK